MPNNRIKQLDINGTTYDLEAIPLTHAASHASTGTDPITPASIGAMAANATPTPAAHASTHLIGGTDALPAASTSQAGLVQIYDGVDSTSTTMAASADAVRLAYNHGSGGNGLNILDNGYFLGAGSQSGGSEFPINQRGLTFYSGDVYGIDRWFGSDSNTTVSLTGGHLVISCSGTIAKDYAIFGQKIDGGGKFAGQAVTLSVLTYASADISFSVNIQTIDSSSTKHQLQYSIPANDGANLYTGNFTLPTDISSMAVYLTPDVAMSSGNKIHLSAIKLEIGKESTLAYFDAASQSFFPREVPNHYEQLARCQYWFYRLKTNNPNEGITVCYAYGDREASGIISFPIMRATPTVKLNSTFKLRGNVDPTVESVAINYIPYRHFATLDCSIFSTSPTILTLGNPYTLSSTSAGATIDFSAEL